MALCLSLSTEPAQAREQLLKNVLGQGGWSTRFLVLTPEYHGGSNPNPNPNPEPDPNPNPNPSPKSNPNQVLKTVDVSYGGENGFNQAIELSSETLTNVKFVQEKKLISKYFEEISQDTGKFCFGIKDTLTALEMGAVQTLQPHTQPQP